MSATVSEALEVLKTADKEELSQEIQIIEEEIDDLKKQIESRRRTIRQVKLLAGIKIVHRNGKPTNGQAAANTLAQSRNGSGEKSWESIYKFLMHNGPSTIPTICDSLGKTFQQVNIAIVKQKGKRFTQLADKRWALIVPKDED
jgi:hypothetical protein